MNLLRIKTKPGLELLRAPAYFLLYDEIFTIVRASTSHSPDRDIIKYQLRVPPVHVPAQPTRTFARSLASVEANTDQFARFQQITLNCGKVGSK